MTKASKQLVDDVVDQAIADGCLDRDFAVNLRTVGYWIDEHPGCTLEEVMKRVDQ